MQFTANHISRSYTIELAGETKEVFYLFEPLGEKEWAEGWNPQILYPTSGEIQEGTVFVTEGLDKAQTIWTILAYDPQAHSIKYLRLAPTSHLALVEIQCRPYQTKTRATVQYTFTALSESGNAYLDKFTESYYRDWIENWGKAINYYLKHRKLLTHH
jgi:hypothetical protein